MDGGLATDPGRHPRVLDNVLRWVCNGTRLEGWSGSDLPGWDQAPLCHPPPLLIFKQCTEYEALINGLRIAIKLGATRLYVRGDSELVVDQVMKESCKSPLVTAYCQEVRKLEDKF